MALGTDHVGVTDAANFIPEIWDRDVRMFRKANLVAAKLVKKIENDKIKYGDTLHIPHGSAETARDKAEETVIAFNSTAESKTDLSINKHKYLAKLIEDIVKAQSIVDQVMIAKEQIGYALAVALDTDLMTLISSGVTQTAGAGDSDLDDAALISGVRQLDVANAPRQNRAIVVHPNQWAALMQIDKFVRADAIGDAGKASPIKTYLIGQIYGQPVYNSTNVYNTGGVMYNGIFHRDAFVLGMQKAIAIKRQYIIQYLGEAIVGHEIYGVTTLRADHACQLLSRTG